VFFQDNLCYGKLLRTRKENDLTIASFSNSGMDRVSQFITANTAVHTASFHIR